MAGQLYNSLNQFLRNLFGEKVKKIPLDAGLTCPNRDGSKGYGGCIYCDSRGSGTGLAKSLSIREQIEFFLKKFQVKGYKKFIAYFQSYTNTYGDLHYLKSLYETIFDYREIVGLAIGTRPDCISEEVLEVLESIREKGYYIWIELGLQSIHNETLRKINRGHTYEDFLSAFELLQKRGFPVCVHVIFGLPGEDEEMMLETIKTLSKLKPQGIKFHALYILENTALAELYRRGDLKPLELDTYCALVGKSLSILPPNVVIHRLTSDPPKEGLLAPTWLLDKNKVIKGIETFLRFHGLHQGSNCMPDNSQLEPQNDLQFAKPNANFSD